MKTVVSLSPLNLPVDFRFTCFFGIGPTGGHGGRTCPGTGYVVVETRSLSPPSVV